MASPPQGTQADEASRADQADPGPPILKSLRGDGMSTKRSLDPMAAFVWGGHVPDTTVGVRSSSITEELGTPHNGLVHSAGPGALSDGHTRPIEQSWSAQARVRQKAPSLTLC